MKNFKGEWKAIHMEVIWGLWGSWDSAKRVQGIGKSTGTKPGGWKFTEQWPWTWPVQLGESATLTSLEISPTDAVFYSLLKERKIQQQLVHALTATITWSFRGAASVGEASCVSSLPRSLPGSLHHQGLLYIGQAYFKAGAELSFQSLEEWMGGSRIWDCEQTPSSFISLEV